MSSLVRISDNYIILTVEISVREPVRIISKRSDIYLTEILTKQRGPTCSGVSSFKFLTEKLFSLSEKM